jgi:hypothetical protein
MSIPTFRRVVEISVISPQWAVASEIVAELCTKFNDASAAQTERREEKNRELRKLRARVFDFLHRLEMGNYRKFVENWKETALQRKVEISFFGKVKSVFKVHDQELKEVVFYELRGRVVEMQKMRQAGRKFALWFLRRELTMSWGSWVAVWSHYKDWRVCALTGCLDSRLKKTTKEELGMFIKSSRGTALLREFADAPVSELAEKIVASRLDVEALETLSVDDLFEAGVFTQQRSNTAHSLINKISRMFVENTERLDCLTIFNGAMLNQISIFEDDVEQKGKTSGGSQFLS